MSDFDASKSISCQDQFRAAWSAAGPAVRQEWIAELFTPACAARPVLSVVVGCRSKEGLQKSWASMGPVGRRQSLFEIERGIDRLYTPQQFDPVTDFLEACTRRVICARTQSTAMHEAYLEWAQANGGIGLTDKRLAKVLHARGIKSIKSSVIYWQDIEVIPCAARRHAAACK